MASLYKRKDSKYICIRFYNPEKQKRDALMTPYLKDSEEDWKEAEDYLRQFNKDLQRLKLEIRIKKKLGIKVERVPDFKTAYQLFKDSKVHIKPGTLTVYDVAVNEHFLKACGDKKLREYSEHDYALLIRRFRSLQRGKNKTGLSLTTQAIYLRHLASLWGYFVKKKWVSENIIQKIKAPKKKPEVIPPDDLQAILNHFKDTNIKHYHTVRLLLNTGWRVSTLLAQRWEKIDMAASHFTAYNVKTSSEFQFPLHKQLRELFLEMGTKKKGPLVDFSCYDSIRNFWEDGLDLLLSPRDESPSRIRKRYTLHQLRKTFNSILANNHFDAKDLMLLLDHSDFKITMENYTDLNMKRIKSEIDDTIKFPK